MGSGRSQRVNNNLYEFEKYFIPEKEGKYNIKINFSKKLNNLSNIQKL